MMSDYRYVAMETLERAARAMFDAYARAVEPMAPDVPHVIDEPYAVIYCDHRRIHVVADMRRRSFVVMAGADVHHCYAPELPKMVGYHPRPCASMMMEMESLARMYDDERSRREFEKGRIMEEYQRDCEMLEERVSDP